MNNFKCFIIEPIHNEYKAIDPDRIGSFLLGRCISKLMIILCAFDNKHNITYKEILSFPDCDCNAIQKYTNQRIENIKYVNSIIE